MVWIFTRKSATALALGFAALFALPNMVFADDPLAVTRAPDIQGKLVVGQTLHAVNGAWTGPADAADNYTWQRCADEDFDDCSTIGGATSDSYTLVDADAGKMMRVTLSVSYRDDSARKSSELTGTVATSDGGSAPGTPGSQQPAFTLTAPPANLGPAIPGLKRIRPKPVITLSGRFKSTGAVITKFTVKAPKGATTSARVQQGHLPDQEADDQGRPHVAPEEVREADAQGRHAHPVDDRAQGLRERGLDHHDPQEAQADAVGQLHPAGQEDAAEVPRLMR